MPRLILEAGGERKEYLVSGSLVIGRSSASQVVLEDKKLSRKHARIDESPQPNGSLRYTLMDLNSKNGTFLNSAPVKSPTALKNGDAIQIGDFVLRYSTKETPLAARSVAAPAPSASGTAVRPPPEREKSGVRLIDRKPVPSSPSGGVRFFYVAFLLILLGAGAYGSKEFFIWLFKTNLS